MLALPLDLLLELVGRAAGLLGLLSLYERHFIGARGCNIGRKLATHRADVSDEFPDLVVGNLALEGRHAVGAALNDIAVDLLGAAAVDPLIIHEGGADASTAVGVAADAVERRVQALTFADKVEPRMMQYNPLGLTIIDFHADQAFH